MIAYNMIIMGNFPGAQKHAIRAQEYAEALGGIYTQALPLCIQARCQMISSNYSEAQILGRKATRLLISCGLEGCSLGLTLQNFYAELHLLKTEYLESRHIQASIIAASKPISYDSILANLNIALIDIACGMGSESIRKNLDQCQVHCESLYGLTHTQLKLVTYHRFAELNLRYGDLSTANIMFKRCFAWSQKLDIEVETACVERLADLSTGMNSIHTTMGWAVIFLGTALRSRDKLATMKAFHCIGQISAVQGDDETALRLFNVALDGFTFMDVHKWRADCMIQLADIWKSRGEALRAGGLWKAARPLFARSSQAGAVAQIDAKLAVVEATMLGHHHERQLLDLAVPNVPAGVLTVIDLERSQFPTSVEEKQECVDRE
jgi:hypothetical protein